MNRRYWILRAATLVAVGVVVAVPMAGFALPNGDQGGRQTLAPGDRDNGKHQGREKGKHQGQVKGNLARTKQDVKVKKTVRHLNQGKSPKKRGLHDNRDQYWKDRQTRRLREQNLARSRQAALDQRLYSDGSNRSLDAESIRRQKTKNEWRNIAILSGAVAVLGILKKDNRLVFAGAAGSLYALYRYEQDRKSQSKTDRLRASYFSRSYFVRDGRRYERRTVTKNGQRYYQFVRR